MEKEEESDRAHQRKINQIKLDMKIIAKKRKTVSNLFNLDVENTGENEAVGIGRTRSNLPRKRISMKTEAPIPF